MNQDLHILDSLFLAIIFLTPTCPAYILHNNELNTYALLITHYGPKMWDSEFLNQLEIKG
jgi:hypothetical protein